MERAAILIEHWGDCIRAPAVSGAHPAHGRYMVVDMRRHIAVAGYDPFDFSLDLDGVADWLRANTAANEWQGR